MKDTYTVYDRAGKAHVLPKSLAAEMETFEEDLPGILHPEAEQKIAKKLLHGRKAKREAKRQMQEATDPLFFTQDSHHP